jgi:DNA-binding NarL/FixJ family response regulator
MFDPGQSTLDVHFPTIADTQMSAEHRPPARILLVDDHPIIRMALRQLLAYAPDLEVCGEADSTGDAIAAVGVLRPDLVIVDLSLRGTGGLDLLRRLGRLHPGLPVVVFSMYEEPAFAELALQAGARAYVMKQEPPDKLLRTIRAALSTAAPPAEGL